MMDQLFTFTYHEQEHILEVRLLGRWKVDDVHSYRKELSRQIASRPAGTVKALIDLSEFPPQQPEVADLNQATVTELHLDEAFVSTVMVGGGAITTMQVNRNLRELNVATGMFADRASAWEALVSR
jgi:hypothetical protein